MALFIQDHWSCVDTAFRGYDEYKDLPYASLCGACTEACPVKIPLHDLLIKHRSRIVQEKYSPVAWNVAMKGFEKR